MSNKSSAVYMELRWGPFFMFLLLDYCSRTGCSSSDVGNSRVFKLLHMYDKRTKEKPKTDYKKGRMLL